jgi:hypothetical protein
MFSDLPRKRTFSYGWGTLYEYTPEVAPDRSAGSTLVRGSQRRRRPRRVGVGRRRDQEFDLNPPADFHDLPRGENLVARKQAADPFEEPAAERARDRLGELVDQRDRLGGGGQGQGVGSNMI